MDNRSSNKFNLKLSSLRDIQGNVSNENDDEELLLNILPSYQMYQSTISKKLTPIREDFRSDPPSYELTPATSNASSIDYFSGIVTPSSPPSQELDSMEESEDFTRWDDTILANAHKLKKLTSMNRDISKMLPTQIFITEHIGRVGVKPNIIDPLTLELTQGDYIYGYILVKNNTDKDIPFDMFSASLEGVITFGNNKTSVVQPPSHISKFLTMFDFNGSWNDACLDRLVTDHNNPHLPMKNVIDPLDDTHVELDHRKILEPGITYKKFFTFKIPEKLLDSSCERHGLIKHLQLPPTLGVSNNEVISSLKKKWTDHSSSEGDLSTISRKEFFNNDRGGAKYASVMNDFSFLDASISYSINVRIIGKASDYEHLLTKGPLRNVKPNSDEYVVANEEVCYLRLIPSTSELFELNRSMMNEESRLMYASLVNQILEKIKIGKGILSSKGDESPISSEVINKSGSSIDLAKIEQSYHSKMKYNRPNNNTNYEVFVPYKKKTLFGSSKIIGLIALSTPKIEYRVNYMPLSSGSKFDKISPSVLTIPIDLTFISSEKTNPSLPDFKKISVELISVTIKSKKLPIPVVFNHDMLFENTGKGPDNFDYIVIRSFQKYAMELSKLLKEIGIEKLDIEKSILEDTKCLANLSSKYDYLKIHNPIVQSTETLESFNLVSSIPWKSESISSISSTGETEVQIKHSKKFNLIVNMTKLGFSDTGVEKYCLVPDFQNCLIARVYHLKVSLKQVNGEKITIKIPIVLQREKGLPTKSIQ